MTYSCILADPPWQQPRVGRFKNPRHSRPEEIPYPMMSLRSICEMPVEKLASDSAHLWLWTTNAFLRQAFDVIDAWGFRYLTTITWVKPSGMGAYFISRTQHLLFGYRSPLRFPMARFKPNVIFAAPKRHSKKPECSLELIESVSPGPRLELFARQKREGWHSWGNEINSDIELQVA